MKWKKTPECGEWPYPEELGDCCPDCGEEFDHPHRGPRCICKDPMYIVIQPGKHIHINCPVHGDVKIYGPRMHWLEVPRGARQGDRWLTKYGQTKTIGMTTSFGPG
jgi:hypothetical protein